MFANLSDIIKIPAAFIAGLIVATLFWLLFYEGISLPFIGQVIDGRVASKVTEARDGYVLLVEKTAAEAKAAEMERQRNAAALSLDEERKRRAADELADQAKQAQTEIEIDDYEKKLAAANRQCVLDDADVKFLLDH